MVDKPVYKTSRGFVYPANVCESLTQGGINKGDVIFVHSDIGVFGKLANFNIESFLGSIIACFKETVGNNGTLVFPTFSYSFCKNEIYDPVQTKSTVGILTEFFRKQLGVIRTKHPIFSVAIAGAHRELAEVGKDSFNDDSIFGKVRQLKGKIVFFGADFHSCTYLHHIEQLHGVSYRYFKTFTGRIRENGQLYDDYATFFVRYLDRVVKLDTRRLEQLLLDEGIMKSVSLGEGKILFVDAQELFDVGNELLEKDPYFFLSEDSTR